MLKLARALWRWLRRPDDPRPVEPYLGPVRELDGRIYEHLGPADAQQAAFKPPWI